MKTGELKEIIDKPRRIVFFTGAGVSVASGIPDFRSSEGLYAYHPEEILSSSYFLFHMEEFFKFYKENMVHIDAEPNYLHEYLYHLEKIDKLKGIVTQNIDGLHKKAGNKRVYELHGSIYENYCMKCETSYPVETIINSEGIPRCSKCNGIIKPYVVLYGEPIDTYTSIGARREISNADTLVVVGTSLSVEPASSYLEYFHGKNLVVINKEMTPIDEKANLVIRDDINDLFKKMLELV